MSRSDVLEHQRGFIVSRWRTARQQHEERDEKKTPIHIDSTAVFAQFRRNAGQAELLRTLDYQPVGDVL